MSSPQRFLANDRNLLRTAALTPSSVLAVANKVQVLPNPHSGAVQVALAGTYSGAEEATYDVEIVDDTVETPLVSAPVFTGAGSGQLTDVAAVGLDAQDISIELGDAGIPAIAAGVDLEGVHLAARAAGAAGDLVHVDIDESALVFTAQNWSLLTDLKAGDGAPGRGLTGPQWDFDTPVLGVDGQVPAASTDNALGAGKAHRIVLGSDRSNVYLQYKQYVDGEWTYCFVPELRTDVAAGAQISFVTGGRTLSVTDGTTTRTYSSIVTLYDALNALKRDASGLINVTGVFANDRSPTGQAARELATKTSAYAQPSHGEGTSAATELADITIDAGAPTELVTLTCFAANAKDAIGAGIGTELWRVRGTVSGALGVATTGVEFATDNFTFTVPTRLPDVIGVAKGKFAVDAVAFAPRDETEHEASICPAGLELGPGAVDQTITLKYVERPSGNCQCADMAVPDLRTACLGITDAEGAMSYSTDAVTRLKSLYDWADHLVTALSQYLPGQGAKGVPDILENFSTQATIKRTISGEVGSGGDDGFGNTFGAAQPTSTAEQSFPETHSITNITRQLGPAGSVAVDKVWTDLPVALDKTLVTTGFAVVALPANFRGVLDTYERALGFIDAVTDAGLRTDGFGKWDDALTAFQGDLNDSELATLGNRLASIAAAKYEILLGKALAYAGVSPKGKFNASTVSADGCWLDYRDAHYWEVTGSESGPYAPAFTNHPYYSSQMTEDGYRSTHEFALQVNVACEGNLKVGDEVTLSIKSAATAGTYQVGDTLSLPIIAAQPLYLSGGQDGSAVQTWYVTGSVAGAFAPFAYDPAAPAAYSDGGLSFSIVPGGIDFAQFDAFRFAVEGGHYKWRKDGGAWSSPAPIPASPDSIDAGLSASFTPGAAPSFVAGDRFSFRALQPWAASNLQTPDGAVWKWDGATATMVADLGTGTQLDLVAFLHTLPEGATLSVEGSADGVTYDWLESLTWRSGVMWKALDHTARYVRLSVASATGAAIQYGWLGTPLATDLSADFQLRRGYKMSRVDGGLIQGGRFLGKAVSGEVTWSEGALTEDDAQALSDMLDWVKEHDDEPLILIPQITRTDEPALVAIVDADSVDLPDLFGYQPDVNHERRLSASLALAGVWR